MKLSRVVIVVTFALFVLPRGEAWGDSSSHDEDKDAGLHDILRSHFRPPLAEYGEPWGLGRYGQMPSQAVQTAKLRGSFRPPLCEYCDEDEDDFDARRRLSWRLRWVKGKKKGRGIRLQRRLHRASQDEDEDDFEARRRLGFWGKWSKNNWKRKRKIKRHRASLDEDEDNFQAPCIHIIRGIVLSC